MRKATTGIFFMKDYIIEGHDAVLIDNFDKGRKERRDVSFKTKIIIGLITDDENNGLARIVDIEEDDFHIQKVVKGVMSTGTV